MLCSLVFSRTTWEREQKVALDIKQDKNGGILMELVKLILIGFAVLAFILPDKDGSDMNLLFGIGAIVLYFMI